MSKSINSMEDILIDSRLEKFLYAIYVSDVDNLPTPLSRIEELYKCLAIGGDIPTFKPSSRVEEYLFAILGAYDINELRAPLSDTEKLLYKLAIGDYNVEDVEIPLSSHEFLLKMIIENGGLGDFEIQSVLLSSEDGLIIVDENGNAIEVSKIRINS